MPHQLPDSVEYHRMLCVVLPDILALLTQLLSHSCHLCVQVAILRLQLVKLLVDLVELLPVCPLCQLSEDVFGSAIIQRLVGTPGDVLQLVVLGLEICQLTVDPFERIFWKILGRNIHVPPSRIPAGFGFQMMMWRGRWWRVRPLEI